MEGLLLGVVFLAGNLDHGLGWLSDQVKYKGVHKHIHSQEMRVPQVKSLGFGGNFVRMSAMRCDSIFVGPFAPTCILISYIIRV